MGFKTFTVFASEEPGYFGTSPIHNPKKAKALLNTLGLKDYELVSEAVDLNDYPKGGQLYIGAYEHGVVIAHPLLPALLFDEVGRNKNFGHVKANGQFCRAIHELFPTGEVMALNLHSVVNMWGFALYRNGLLMRCASGAEGVLHSSIGTLLPEEKPMLAKHSIDSLDSGDVVYSEDLVFDVSQRMLGYRYDELDLEELKCSYFKRRSWLSRLLG